MKKLFLLITVTVCSLILNISSVKAWEYDGSNNVYYNYVSTYNESYYSSLSGLSGDTFKAELNDIITDNYNRYTYSERLPILREADAMYNDSNSVWCMYTGKIFSVNDNGSSGTSTWNTEHTWAKSWGFPDTSDVPYSDMHHLRITECQTNAYRSNSWFGEVSNPTSTDNYGNKWTSSIFEPRDSVKGDIARMLLYMDVRYEGENGETDLVLIDGYTATSGSSMHGDLETLLKWHNQDPVDDRERERNDVIFSYQQNRNPFVDHPEYANVIWGNGIIDNDQEIATNFDNLVLSIQTPITLDSRIDILTALITYSNLTDSQQALTTKYSLLLEYKETLDNLSGGEYELTDDDYAQIFDQLVNNINSNITLASEQEITNTLYFYSQLTNEQQLLTTNYDLLLEYYEELIILQVLLEVEDDLDILDLILKGDYESLFDYIN